MIKSSRPSLRERGTAALFSAFALTLWVAAPFQTYQTRPAAAAAPANVTQFTLENGIKVVVIPDHRVPVVTHMVWYAVGAADEGPDEHGVAHYLEHMMFKGTAAYPKGQFDRFVTSRGGAHNATTSLLATKYYQRVPKPALPQLMAMEADRMVNLHIEDGDVASERSVVMEEYRRQEVGLTSGISKQIRATLFEDHPEGRPVIGTEAEINALNGAKAQGFYERFYGPGRAIVVIAGDITETEARALAADTYAKVPARANLAPRVIAKLPPQGVAMRVEAAHDRATAAMVSRSYIIPGFQIMGRRDAQAANLFAYIAGNGMTSRLYRQLITEKGKATSVSCSVSIDLDSSGFDCSAVGRVGVSGPDLEAAFVAVLDALADGGVTDEEFSDIKSRFLATGAYRNDNVFNRADTYGSVLTEGMPVALIENVDADIVSLTRADVERVAKSILRGSRNVTGLLVPQVSAVPVAAPAAK